MAIYAYGDPQECNRKFVYDSLVKDAISRFMYSRFDNCDLNRLRNVPEYQMVADERTAWKKGQRLLDFRPGDWILHKDVPIKGQVTAARLSSEYFYQAEMPAQHQDGRQYFRVDKVFEFTRIHQNVHGIIYSRLTKQGSLRQIHYKKEFYESLIALGYEIDDIDRKRLAELNVDAGSTPEHFKRELKAVFADMEDMIQRDWYHHGNKTLKDFLSNFFCEIRNVNEKSGLDTVFEDLAKVIQRHYPGKRLEAFLSKIYRNMKDVAEVVENGLRGGTDHGADLIVISHEDMTLVQVKSYAGEVSDIIAVNQLETAINYYTAKGYRITRGEVITTGLSTPALKKAMKELADKMWRRKQRVIVELTAGSDFAKFVLEFGWEFLYPV